MKEPDSRKRMADRASTVCTPEQRMPPAPAAQFDFEIERGRAAGQRPPCPLIFFSFSASSKRSRQ